MKKFISLKTKTVGVLTALLFVACIALGNISYLFSKDRIEKNTMTLISEISKIASGKMESQIHEEFNNIETLASIPDIGNEKTPWDVKSKILESNRNVNGYDLIGIVDKSGNCVLTDGSKLNVKDREYFTKAMNGETNITEPYVARVNNKLVITIAAPIRNGNEITGVLVITKDGKEISRISKDITFAKSG